MDFLRRNFGFEKVHLSEEEQLQLIKQLKKVDENRLEFFALITFICILIIYILDFLYFDQSLRKFYLFIDTILLLGTISQIIFSFIDRKKSSSLTIIFKEISFSIYPALLILWACAVYSLDPTSMLNFITFYFMLFLITFSVIAPIKTLLIYYILVTIEYILFSLMLDKPIFTETFFIIELGFVLAIPLYYSFRSIRVNSQSAMIKLNSMNNNLKNEVELSIRELQHLNDNLNIEVGQRKVIESKLRESLKLVESSNQLKSEFLSNISHEIRTPLNSIVGFTEMITEEGVPPDRKKEYQELISSNTMYLLSTIDDIFDASMLKTEQISPVPRPYRVKSFLENICYEANGIEMKYKKKHLNFIQHRFDNNELMINSDDFYLKKALIRLIDNAYKFTEKGNIEVGAIVAENGIEFFVSDTGIGIAEKDMIRIFDPFVQGDGSFTRGYGGSGLGLTIVIGLVKTLGAEFNFQSTQGVGSTFTIHFNKYFLQ